MGKNLYVIRKYSSFVILILMFYFLPLQSTSATVIEYSISGGASVRSTSSDFNVEVIGKAFIDDENYNIGNPDCITDFNQVHCDPTFNITYFDMYVSGQYNYFTGTNGFITYTPSDVYGSLYGTGDWSMMRHSDECGNNNAPCADFFSYEEFLAFELPTLISWESGPGACIAPCGGEIVVNNPLLTDVWLLGFTLERIGPVSVSEPSIIMLMTTGLIGLIVFTRRKA